MIGNARTTLDRRLLTRRCVSCGFDGPAINRSASAIENCPRCGCDLTERPPRSYAEMEGLLGMPSPALPRELVVIDRTDHAETRGERVLQRWLAFMFISMVGLLAIAYLAASIMAV